MAHNTITAISGAAPSSLNPPVCAVFASIRPMCSQLPVRDRILGVEAGTRINTRYVATYYTSSSDMVQFGCQKTIARKHIKERLCTSINVS
jgi:hypothetical protein